MILNDRMIHNNSPPSNHFYSSNNNSSIIPHYQNGNNNYYNSNHHPNRIIHHGLAPNNSNNANNSNNSSTNNRIIKPVVLRYQNMNDKNFLANLKNKSMSSSMSSSSSPTSASAASSSSTSNSCNIGINSDNNINSNYKKSNQLVKQQHTSISPQFNTNTDDKPVSSQMNIDQSCISKSSNKNKNLTDRHLTQQVKVANFNAPNQLQQQTSSSYTYNPYNSNRLSSYDNHDLHDYLDMNKNANQQSLNNSNNDESRLSNCDTLPAYLVNGKYGKKRGSTNASTQTKSINASVNSSNLSLSNEKGLESSMLSNKSSSNGNLISRALNYARKSTSSSSTNSTQHKQSWKSKLGKYLTPSAGAKSLSKRGSQEGCDIIIDEDIYSSYHLTRRNPINRESIMALSNEIKPTTASNSNAFVNLNNTPKNNQLMHSSSNSSSELASSSYTSPSTSVIVPVQNYPLAKQAAITKKLSLNEKTLGIYTDKDSSKEKNGMNGRTNNKTKKSKSLTTANDDINLNEAKQKPNLKKKDSLEHQQQQHQTFNLTTSLNKLSISNGFNSLRKILKLTNKNHHQSLSHVTQNMKAQAQENAQIRKETKAASVCGTPAPNLNESSKSSGKLNNLSASENHLQVDENKNSNRLSVAASNDDSVSISSGVQLAHSSTLSTPSSSANKKSEHNLKPILATSMTLDRTKKKQIKKQMSFSIPASQAEYSGFPKHTHSASVQTRAKDGSHSPRLSYQSLSLPETEQPPRLLEDEVDFGVGKKAKSSLVISESLANTPRKTKKQANNQAGQSKVMSVFKVYKNIVNKMNKNTNGAPAPAQKPKQSASSSRFYCLNKQAAKGLLNNEFSCVRNECNYLNGNASASTISGIGYFRSSSPASNLKCDSNENTNEYSREEEIVKKANKAMGLHTTPIKIYDGYKSLIQQISVVETDITNNNKSVDQDDCFEISNNNKVIRKNSRFTAVQKKVYSIDDDVMCDLEVASFFDHKKLRIKSDETDNQSDCYIHKENEANDDYDASQNDFDNINNKDLTISYVNNYFNDQNFDSNEDLNQLEHLNQMYDYNDNENGNNYDYDVLEQDDMNYLETNSQEMDANDYELEVDEDRANYGSSHYDDDEDTQKLKYLVQQLAAEASLSSVNLNGKIILKKENQNNGSAKYKNQNLVNHINTYLNKTNKNLKKPSI